MTTIVINPTQRSALAESFNEKTSLTWLWSLLFGPLWFLVNGFIGWGLALFGLGVVIAVFGAVEPAF